MYHEAAFQVGARDTDLFGLCRPSSLLDFLQEIGRASCRERV